MLNKYAVKIYKRKYIDKDSGGLFVRFHLARAAVIWILIVVE